MMFRVKFTNLKLAINWGKQVNNVATYVAYKVDTQHATIGSCYYKYVFVNCTSHPSINLTFLAPGVGVVC